MLKEVLKGATFLDSVHPSWYQEINVDTLDMSDPCHCILGQLYDGVHSMCPLSASLTDYGFFDTLLVSYDLLERNWVQAIRERKAS